VGLINVCCFVYSYELTCALACAQKGVSNCWTGIWNGTNGKWNGTVNTHSYS